MCSQYLDFRRDSFRLSESCRQIYSSVRFVQQQIPSKNNHFPKNNFVTKRFLLGHDPISSNALIGVWIGGEFKIRRERHYHIYEDTMVSDISWLKSPSRVQEAMDLKITEQSGEFIVQRRDYEDVRVVKPHGISSAKKKRGRPRKNVSELQAVLGWGEDEMVDAFRSQLVEEKESVVEEEMEEVVEIVYGLIQYTEKDEAMLFGSSDGHRWSEANSLERCKVLTETNIKMLDPSQPLPSRPLPIILLYTRKRPDAKGFVRYKCRSVVLGNLQNCSLPTYAPVISIAGVRIMLTYCISENISSSECFEMFDLANAFLNAPLDPAKDGQVVVKLPQSWVDGTNSKYGILKRALYGLKISPSRWFSTLRDGLLALSWVECCNCLFSKTVVDPDSGKSHKVYLVVYVDDCIVASPTLPSHLRKQEIQLIFGKFKGNVLDPKISDDGKIYEYDVNGVQLRVNFEKKEFKLHMTLYTKALLEKYGMDKSTPAKHPRVNPDLIAKQTELSTFPIRECLGALIWLSTTARPDIVYDISLCARYAGRGLTKGVEGALKKILKYLGGSITRGLQYSPRRERIFRERFRKIMEEQCNSNEYGHVERSLKDFSSNVVLFGDASFATCPVTLRSQSGIAIYFKGCIVSYRTKRQSIITKSTMAAEFVAASDCLDHAEELEPHLRLFDPPEVGIPQLEYPLMCDNTSAIRVARNDVLNNASKHLKIKHMAVSDQHRRIFYVPTNYQEGDAFTKSLSEAVYGMMVLYEQDV